MELEEALAELKKVQKAVTDLTDEKTRILGKNDELLTETKAAKKARGELQTQFETLTADFISFKEEAALGADTKKQVDELVAQKVEKVTSDFETRFGTINEQLAESQGQYKTLKSQYDGERINGGIRKAAEAAKVLPTAIDDVISRANGIFALSEENKIESRDADGNLRKIGKKIMSPDTFVESLKETAPHLWPTSTGSGAQGNQGGGDSGANPFAKDTLNYTEQAKLMQNDPDKARRLQEQVKAA